MSFSLTTAQFKTRTKTVTRRLGWSFLKPGDLVMGCEKCMGLKKGEKVRRLGVIQITGVRRELLCHIHQTDVVKEGFPGMAYLTGLRRADILNLKLTDMTSDGIAVTVAKSRRPGSAPKRLLFEWSPELRTVVRKLRDMPRRIASVYLFATKFGTRITDSAFSTAWTRFQKRLEAASIERFQMKDLRAKHGSDIDEQGGDASRHLAHSSPATTRRHYLRKPAKITPIRRK